MHYRYRKNRIKHGKSERKSWQEKEKQRKRDREWKRKTKMKQAVEHWKKD